MSGGLRRLARHVAVYGSGRLGLQLFSLITLPILTRVFTPSDYGIMETITTFVLLVGIVATLALDSSVQRSYFDYGDDQVRERRVVVSTAFWTVVIWSAVLAAVLAALSPAISELVFGTRSHWPLFALALVTLPLSIATAYFQEILRLRQRPALYVGIGFLGTGATVAAVLLLVLVADLGLTGVYLGGLVAAPLPLLLGFLLARRSLALAFSSSELRIMLAYALPLLPVAATTWIIQFADRFFVLHWTSAADLGLYAVGVRLANVLLLAVVAFGIAWAPFILDLYARDPEQERHTRARAFGAVAVALGFGAICIGVFAREFLSTVTDPSFEGAYKVVTILLVGTVALGLNGVTMTAISLTRKTKYFARYAVYTSLFNIALNFLLIPPFGIVGAAVATSATYVLLAALYYGRAQRLDRAAFDVRTAAVALSVAALIVAVASPVRLEPLWLSVLVKLPFVLLYPLLAWRLGWVRTSAPLFRSPVTP
jgi:O-antigen/teichoic acid export membrane protein